jgi:FlaA1/EpsC-like NDP-sugar epimerase
MRWAFGFLTLCIVLAVVRAVLIAIAIATVLALIFYFATRPRETLLFMGVLVVTGLAAARPALFIVTLGALGLALLVAGNKRKRRAQLLLTGRGESS